MPHSTAKHRRLVSILAPPEGGAQLMCADQFADRYTSHVSILAPPEGGAQRMPPSRRTWSALFQSSLPPKEERNHLIAGICSDITVQQFQSSLPPKEERNPGHSADPLYRSCFNPRSPRRRSATVARSRNASPCHDVSILAPPEGGAQRSRVSTFSAQQCHRFNPRSPRRRSATTVHDVRSWLVSILAPPEGGAQRA